MFMPSEPMIGGLAVVIREKTVLNNGELHRIKIMDTVARYPTRLLDLKDKINFLSVSLEG